MEVDNDSFSFSQGETCSHVSSDISRCDPADVQDGVPDYDAWDMTKMSELWSPHEVAGGETTLTASVAAQVFHRSDSPQCSLPDYEDYIKFTVLPHAERDASEAGDTEASTGRAPKTSKSQKDSGTALNVEVIRRVVEKITEEGGIESARFSFVDFECAASLSAQCTLPCEVGIVTCRLTLNDLLSLNEAVLVGQLHEAEDSLAEAHTHGIEEHTELYSRIAELQGLLRDTPATGHTWYHRILHPGLISSAVNHRTACCNVADCHGIPLEGIDGAAKSRDDAYDILLQLEEHCRAQCFHVAKNPEAVRLFPPPSPTECRALLFGHNVAVERGSLNSIAMRARGEEGEGPFRWDLPIYDIQHLIQAFYVMAREKAGARFPEGLPELLSWRAMDGIVQWLLGSNLPMLCSHRCGYHDFLEARFQHIYQEDGRFHCALHDAMCTAERVRFVMAKYFPVLLEGAEMRHAVSSEWPSLPMKKGSPPDVDVQRALDDLKTHACISVSDGEFTSQQWETQVKDDVFSAVQRSVADGNVEAAGRLTLSWCIMRTAPILALGELA